MQLAYTRQQQQQQLRRQQQSQQSLRQQRVAQGQRQHPPRNTSGNNSLFSSSSPVNNVSRIFNSSTPTKSANSPSKSWSKSSRVKDCKCQRISNGLRETFISLALLCFVSLFTAFLSLVFLQKTSSSNISSLLSGKSDSGSSHQSAGSLNDVTSTRVSSVEDKEYIKVTQICVSLSTITVSLNLCSLFVCCIQFLSGAALLKTPQGTSRTIDFFKKTSNCRLIAIAAFALSIPIFFTGLILFVFVNFDEVAAITTSFAIAVGIIFCGVSCVQTVYLWQDAKTKSVSQLSDSISSNNNSPLNSTIKLELSTLV